MASEKKRRRAVPIIVILIFFITFCFAVVEIFFLNADLEAKKTEYEDLQKRLHDLQLENELLERYTDEEYRKEYVEKFAREHLNYSYPDEQVYYFIPEN